MKALLYKDLCVLKKSLWYYVLFYVIYTVFMLQNGQYSLLIGMMMMLGLIIPSSAMAYDEQVQWGRFGQALPFTKKQMVFEKYLLGFVCLLSAGVLAFVTITGCDRLGILKETTSVAEYAAVSLAVLFVGVLMIAVTLPMNFWLGVERGKLAFIGISVLFLIVLMSVVSMAGFQNAVVWMEQNPALTVLLVLSAICAITVGSYLISVSIYKKKEFQ